MAGRLVLAQVASRPSPLPGAPILERLFLENQTIPAAAVAATGIVAAWWLIQRAQVRRGALIAVAGLLLGAGLYLVGASVETRREAMRAATARLVDATARVDGAALDELLSEDVRLLVPGGAPLPIPGGPGGLDKDAIIALVRATLGGQYAVRGYKVVQTEAVVDGPANGRTQTRVSVTAEGYGLPYISWWRLAWRREGPRWRAISIEPVALP